MDNHRFEVNSQTPNVLINNGLVIMLIIKKVTSGPRLVSRTGERGSTLHLFKEPKHNLPKSKR